jgi:hypothetical protein
MGRRGPGHIAPALSFNALSRRLAACVRAQVSFACTASTVALFSSPPRIAELCPAADGRPIFASISGSTRNANASPQPSATGGAKRLSTSEFSNRRSMFLGACAAWFGCAGLLGCGDSSTEPGRTGAGARAALRAPSRALAAVAAVESRAPRRVVGSVAGRSIVLSVPKSTLRARLTRWPTTRPIVVAS